MKAALNLKRLENVLKNLMKKNCAFLSKSSGENKLFLCMHFSNKHRSGVSTNMLQEFKRSQQQDWNYIVHVMSHETEMSGPAMVH